MTGTNITPADTSCVPCFSSLQKSNNFFVRLFRDSPVCLFEPFVSSGVRQVYQPISEAFRSTSEKTTLRYRKGLKVI